MKNSTTKILTIAVVLLLLINVAMLIFILRGKGKSGSDDHGKGGGFELMVKELNMTEEQQTAYKKLKEEHFAAARPLFDSVKAAKQAFFALSKEENVSDSTINAYSARVTTLQATTDKMVLAHFRKVRNLFKDEQQRKFDEFVQKMMQRGPGRKRDSTSKEKK